MVILHVKRSEESQFLHSCSINDNVESVLKKVTEYWLTYIVFLSFWNVLDSDNLQWKKKGGETGRGGEGSCQTWGHYEA